MLRYAGQTSHARRRRGDGRPAWVLPAMTFVAVALPIGLAAAHFGDAIANAPRYDATWCTEGREAESDVTILVDRTDPLSDRHRVTLHEVFEGLAAERNPTVAARGRITILAVDGQNGGLMREIDSFCRPPLDGDESGTGATRRHLAPIYARYQARLRQDEANVDSIVPVSDWSPLLESVKQVAQRAEFGANVRPRRLVLVSDLLQHVPGRMLERDAAKTTLPAFLRTTYGAEQRVDLRGVEVQVVLLERRRARALQTAAHETFWQDWFAEMGAKVVEFRRIPE